MDEEINNEFWRDTMSFKPTETVRGMFAESYRFDPSIGGPSPYFVQRIQDAKGVLVNFDFYAVRIGVLPTVDGRQVQASELLEYIRKHLNDFVDNKLCRFTPNRRYSDNVKRWNSTRPLGSVVRIAFGDPK